MSCDLEVDTDELHRAATMLRQAAEQVSGGCPAGRLGVGGHAAGGSAAGREALRVVIARAEQACLAVTGLAGTAARLADLLDSAAAEFDAAEALCRGGG